MIQALAVILVACAFGCSSAVESEWDPPSLGLWLYPAGGDADLRYTITVVGDSIVATNHGPSQRGDPASAEGALRPVERDSLTQLAAAVTDFGATADTLEIEDAWGATLFIEGEPVYHTDDFSFERPPPPVGELVRYLRKLTELNIDLYSFS